MILLATYYLLLSIITIAIVHIQEEREGRVLQEAFYLTGMCPYQSLTNTIQFNSDREKGVQKQYDCEDSLVYEKQVSETPL